MKSFVCTPFVLASLLAGVVACSGSDPSSETGTTSDNISSCGGENPGEAGGLCLASPPPNARCAKACPHGFKGAAGTHTCECCPTPNDEDAGVPDETEDDCRTNECSSGKYCAQCRTRTGVVYTCMNNGTAC